MHPAGEPRDPGQDRRRRRSRHRLRRPPPDRGALYPGAGSRAPRARLWILTRILWLSGLEPGRNRLGRVDTMRRYIYIHGCPDDTDITIPAPTAASA